MHAVDVLILGCKGGLERKGLLGAERGDFAIWSYEIWLGSPSAGGNVGERRRGNATALVKRSRSVVFDDLGEAACSILLQDSIDRRELEPVEEDAEAASDEERASRRPGEAEAWAEVQGILRQSGGEVVVFIAQAVIERECV